MTNPMLPATMAMLQKLVAEIFEQLDGIPEDDLNTWLPRDGMRDVNTFFALATHTVGAGEFWILEAAGGRNMDRNRRAEFASTGSLAQLRERYDRWLEGSEEVFFTIDDEDLASIYYRPATPERGMSESPSHPRRMHRSRARAHRGALGSFAVAATALGRGTRRNDRSCMTPR
ncbi:MAG: hypothetical protein R2855_11295 [Thermomicrobiales bacterium]